MPAEIAVIPESMPKVVLAQHTGGSSTPGTDKAAIV